MVTTTSFPKLFVAASLAISCLVNQAAGATWSGACRDVRIPPGNRIAGPWDMVQSSSDSTVWTLDPGNAHSSPATSGQKYPWEGIIFTATMRDGGINPKGRGKRLHLSIVQDNNVQPRLDNGKFVIEYTHRSNDPVPAYNSIRQLYLSNYDVCDTDITIDQAKNINSVRVWQYL